jgi:hypothetical protein
VCSSSPILVHAKHITGYSPPTSSVVRRLSVQFDASCHVILITLGTALTLGVELLPLAAPTPCAKALMIRIVTRKMAVLGEPLFLVAAGNESDIFVITHVCCSRLNLAVGEGYFRQFICQFMITVGNRQHTRSLERLD